MDKRMNNVCSQSGIEWLFSSLSLYYEVGSTKKPRFKALGASLKVKKVAEWTSLDVLRQKVQR